MKNPHLIALFLLLGFSSVVYGQEGFRKRFSLELGAGQGPLHMQFVSPSWSAKKVLAEKGQRADTGDGIYPAIALSGVLRTSPRWETVATACVSWSHCRIRQYDTFGIDPQGKPRYDLTKGTPAGWKDLSPAFSLTVQERVAWNPEWKVRMYSAFGVGLSTYGLIPLPSLTPVGCSYGGKHLYFYAEIPLSPYATFFHAGIGWSF